MEFQSFTLLFARIILAYALYAGIGVSFPHLDALYAYFNLAGFASLTKYILIALMCIGLAVRLSGVIIIAIFVFSFYSSGANAEIGYGVFDLARSVAIALFLVAFSGGKFSADSYIAFLGDKIRSKFKRAS